MALMKDYAELLDYAENTARVIAQEPCEQLRFDRLYDLYRELEDEVAETGYGDPRYVYETAAIKATTAFYEVQKVLDDPVNEGLTYAEAISSAA